MTETFFNTFLHSLLMHGFDVKHVTILKRNGEFLLYDPTAPAWVRIPPLGALMVAALTQGSSLDFLKKSPSLECSEKILNDFLENVREKMRHEPQNKEKGTDIEINLTESCSFKCKYCYFSYKSRKNLKIEEWKDIIDSAAQLHPDRLIFSGGDPLLREDLFEIAKFAHDQSLKTHLVSSGIIPQEKLSSVAAWFDSVQISIDGFPKTQRYLRGVPFERVMKNMKELICLGVPLKAGITLTSINIGEVVPLVETLTKNGICRFHLSLFKEVGRGKNHPELKPRPKAVVALFLRMLQLAVDVDTLFHLMPKQSEKRENCGAGREILSVMPDGDVYPCDALISKEFLCGSALREDLVDIYRESPVLKMLRAQTVESSPICSSCDFRYLCGGGCIGESFSQTGTVEIPGPDCTFLKQFYEEFIWIA